MNRSVRIRQLPVRLAGLALLAQALPADAAQTELHHVTLDATSHCQLVSGSANFTPGYWAIGQTGTLRCPLDFPESSSGAVDIVEVTGYGRNSSLPVEALTYTLYRRSPAYGAAREAIGACTLPKTGVAASCSVAPSGPTTAVDEASFAYYLEIACIASSTTCRYWQVSGAQVAFTWENGP